MIIPLSSVAEFDSALLAEFREVEVQLSGLPEADRQQRFADLFVFPHLGWGLIGALRSEASRTNDPLVLAGGLSRFIKCAHSHWGREDAHGRHSGGYDYCTLVETAMYSALLGGKYVRMQFHAERTLSRYGYPAYRHSANLIVALECAAWRHGDKARTAGTKFVESKSAAAVDKNFVATLLFTLEGDRARADAALARFADGYLKSDWGRRKPFTKEVFIRAVATYCGGKLGGEALAVAEKTPSSPEGSAPWDRLREMREGALLSEYRFPAPLEFLDSTVSVGS